MLDTNGIELIDLDDDDNVTSRNKMIICGYKRGYIAYGRITQNINSISPTHLVINKSTIPDAYSNIKLLLKISSAA